MAPKPHEHPDAETLACFVERSLPEESRKEVERHLAQCEECFEVFREALAINDRLMSSPPADGPVATPAVAAPESAGATRGLRPWMLVAALAAVLTIASTALILPRGRMGPAGQLTRLVAEERWFAPRLSSEFAGPARPVPVADRMRSTSAGRRTRGVDSRRGWEESRSIASSLDAVERALVDLRAAAPDAAETDPATAHAMAVAEVVLDNTTPAIERLERLTHRSPDEAGLWNDLAVARLRRHEERRRSRDLVAAIDALERGLTRAPDDAALAFNMALAIDALPIPGDPLEDVWSGIRRRTWDDYLAIERSRSDWREEALLRRAEIGGEARDLQTPALEAFESAWANETDLIALATRSPAGFEGFLTRRALKEWGQSLLAGTPLPAARRDALQRAADAIVAGGGGALSADLLAQLAQADDPDRLARAHVAYGDALELQATSDIEAALERLTVAERNVREDEPLWLLIKSRQALIPALGIDLDATSVPALLDRMAGPPARDYPDLEGLLHWMRALGTATEAGFERAAADWKRSSRLFERSNNHRNAIRALALSGEALDFAGQEEHAWEVRRRALAVVETTDTPMPYNPWSDCALAALDQGYPAASARFLREWERGAAEDGIEQCDRLTLRAEIALALDRKDDALAALDQLDEVVAGLKHPEAARRFKVESIEIRAEVLEGAPGTPSPAELDELVAYWEEVDVAARLPEVYLLRGRLYEASGDDEAALADYRRGLAAFEVARDKALDVGVRVALVDRGSRLTERIAALELRRERPAEALDAWIRFRSVELRDGTADDVVTVAQQLPASTAAVAYLVLDEQAFGWVLAAGRVRGAPLPISTTELEELASRLQPDRAESPEAVRDALERLYRALLHPFAAELAAVDTLAVAADRQLHRVPFAALIDADTGRAVIEDLTVVSVPTLRVGETRPTRDGGWVVVGDPAFDPERYPELVSLPESRVEATSIASLHPGAKLLQQRAATPAALRNALDQGRKLHFAGHARPGQRDALDAALVLAPDPTGEDLLRAQQLLQLDGSSLDLVVLGGCRTADGPLSRSEGAIGLTWALLAAGVPEVVGTYWNLDDRDGRELLVSFHSEMAKGRSPAEALRDTQRRAARQGYDPRTWANLVLWRRAI